jgi:phage terminase large subunit GpA-like protein
MTDRTTRIRALSIVLGALALGIAPDPVMKPSAWAAENLFVPDGPFAGKLWNPDQTPQLVEIIDRLGPADPCTKISLRKSGQLGATTIGIAWLGFIAAKAPAQTLTVFPTRDTVARFNADKLQPAIERSPSLRAKIREQTSRSATGSTTRSKRFAGGSIELLGANSAPDLASQTGKYVFADEIDRWPLDLEGQGDPMAMVDARQISFRRSGEFKKFQASTPTIKGVSRIDAEFEEGDQRFWHVPCPHCGAMQVLRFKNLKFVKTKPHAAAYKCEAKGCQIDQSEAVSMIRAGRWIATNPAAAPGHHSYHLDALSSLLVTWEDIADEFVKSKDDPLRYKAFVNLWLGEAWEERGEAPPWKELLLRREKLRKGLLPAGALMLTAGVDVQKTGVYYEVVAWGVGMRSWSIDFGFLDGDTSDPDSEIWRKLDELHGRTWPNAHGREIGLDALGVDSGYQSHLVYAFCRARPRAFALKGVSGWSAPPIGVPSLVDVDVRGRKVRKGCQLWPVGTWSLKSTMYANLRKSGQRAGEEADPPGYCAFSADHDRRFFEQLTAEYVHTSETKTGMRSEWRCQKGVDNHFHDCRVYAMAMASHLGLDRWTADRWSAAAEERDCPVEQAQLDMLTASPFARTRTRGASKASRKLSDLNKGIDAS